MSDRYSARWIKNYTNSKLSHAIQVFILDDVDTMGVATLNPAQAKTVNYVIIFTNETKGLWTHNLVIENVNTKDVHSTDISVFFDPAAMGVVSVGAVPAREGEIESLDNNEVGDGINDGTVYCSTSPTQLYVRADGAVAGKYELVRCADPLNTVGLYKIRNNTAETLQIYPLANLPLSVEVMGVESECVTRGDSLTTGTTDTYQRCGVDIVIPANTEVTVRVCGQVGSLIPVPSRSRSALDNGNSVLLKGKLGFIVAGTTATGLDCIPFLAYQELLCNVIVPRIEIPAAQLAAHLGEYRRGYKVIHTFSIRNTCDLPVPITLANLPPWLVLTSESIDTLVTDSFTLPGKSLSNFNVTGFIPQDLGITCTALDINFFLTNCCYNQATELRLKLDIDNKSAISLLLSAMEQDVVAMDESSHHHVITAAEPVLVPSNNVTANVDSLANVKLVLRNNLNRLLKIRLSLHIPRELQQVLLMNIAVSGSNELFQLTSSGPAALADSSNNELIQLRTNDSFHVLPGDSNEIKITFESHADARITREILRYISSVTPEDLSDVGAQLGSVTLGAVELLVLNEQDEVENEVYRLDVCGRLQPGPTIQLQNELEVKNISFIAIDNAATSEGSPVGDARSNPSLRLETEATAVTVYNASSTPVLYTTKPKFYKHLGMRLKFNDDNEGEYDTIMVLAEPSMGSIPPLSTCVIRILLRPGNTPNIGDHEVITCKQDHSDSSSNGLMTIMDMSVDIYDDEFDFTHPPQLIQVLLASKIALPIIISKPLTNTNRSKIHLGGAHSHDNLLGNYDDNDGSSVHSANMSEKALSASASADVSRKPSAAQLGPEVREKPKIRLRGVTPVVDTQDCVFEINLGQQILGQESIEWLITLENCSAIDQVRFKILHMVNNSASWLIFGQNRGSIDVANSFSLTLYFYRAVLGSFFTYFVIENVDNKADYQLVRVSIEVIEENANIDVDRDNSYREMDPVSSGLPPLPQSIGGGALPMLKTVDMLIASKLNILERNLMILCRSFSELWTDLLEVQYLHADYTSHQYLVDQESMSTPAAPLQKQLLLATEVLLDNSDLVVTDAVLFINKVAIKARLELSTSMGGAVLTSTQRTCHRIASRLADLFLLYQGIMDQLIIHKLSRQLVNVGNNNIQVECLAQVLFVLMFRSYVFDMVLQDAEEFPLLVKPFLHLFFRYYTITGQLLTHSCTHLLTYSLSQQAISCLTITPKR